MQNLVNSDSICANDGIIVAHITELFTTSRNQIEKSMMITPKHQLNSNLNPNPNPHYEMHGK